MATKKTSTVVKSEVNTKTEREKQLENEVMELKNMMQKILENQNAIKDTPKPLVTIDYVEEDEEDIPFNKLIKVMSLTNHRLTLSTEGYGRGTLYNFVEFGEVQPIVYSDLSKIIHNNPTFTRQGAYFIMNSLVVKKKGLTNFYEKILDKDSILNILNLEDEKIISMFKNTTKKIQDTIVSILVNKLVQDEYVDLNKLQVISNVYGQDINFLAGKIKNKNNEV